MLFSPQQKLKPQPFSCQLLVEQHQLHLQYIDQCRLLQRTAPIFPDTTRTTLWWARTRQANRAMTTCMPLSTAGNRNWCKHAKIQRIPQTKFLQMQQKIINLCSYYIPSSSPIVISQKTNKIFPRKYKQTQISLIPCSSVHAQHR